MSKIAVVYWSGTGNTQEMALAVADGAKAKGAEADLFAAADFDSSMLSGYDAVAFGCPSMGAEQLEESEFEPMFEECKDKLSNKKVALFGSYGWGDGEWMRNWEDDCAASGITLAHESVICNEAPDSDAIESCTQLGASLA